MGEVVRWPQTRALLNPRAGRASFDYFQGPPAPDVAWFAEHYWVVSWDLRGRQPHRQQVLPHPRVQLTAATFGRRRVAGVLRDRHAEQLSGAGFVVGVAFRPGGFRPLLDAPVSSITDRFLPVASVLGSDVDAATRRILADCAAAPDRLPAVATDGLDGLLRSLAPRPDPRVEEAAAAVAGIAGDPALTRVADAAAATGLTPRGLQRLFAEYVGVGPKWVIRRYRLHEAAGRAAAGGPVDWAAVAADLGYADQAHFTRDFTATIGTSPARYARDCAAP